MRCLAVAAEISSLGDLGEAKIRGYVTTVTKLVDTLLPWDEMNGQYYFGIRRRSLNLCYASNQSA
ncbi:hypothetical protein Cylst_2105 [Cylindrospermum stagnale PCC 7417]|uniref:Uncharacterized protein n=1 Tax=Cylindrospermum stagnale PCC 7417 TaxID=56107 RepID=K9WX01_9NOST|nr:hypothetical protein [Cylindrospermum stagnale]AFZ24344.1 hypothetical protein Cylst_2105 [Cylindrospermum stagnale PCC 7417]